MPSNAERMTEAKGKLTANRFNEEGSPFFEAFAGYLSHDTLHQLHKTLEREVAKRRKDRADGTNNYPY